MALSSNSHPFSKVINQSFPWHRNLMKLNRIVVGFSSSARCCCWCCGSSFLWGYRVSVCSQWVESQVSPLILQLQLFSHSPRFSRIIKINFVFCVIFTTLFRYIGAKSDDGGVELRARERERVRKKKGRQRSQDEAPLEPAARSYRGNRRESKKSSIIRVRRIAITGKKVFFITFPSTMITIFSSSFAFLSRQTKRLWQHNGWIWEKKKS